MFGIFIYDLLFFAIPTVILAFFGVSLYRYITQRRLIAAKTHIQNGATLEQVSRDVGFADYSTFYRAFKQEFGISPRRYRELQGGER